MIGGVAVEGHDAAVVGIIKEVGPENFVAAEIIFLGSGQIAVTAIGIAVKEKQRIGGHLPNVGADSGHDFVGNAAEAAVIEKEVLKFAGGALPENRRLVQAAHFLQPAGAVNAGRDLGLSCNGLSGGIIGNIGVKSGLAGEHSQRAYGLRL